MSETHLISAVQAEAKPNQKLLESMEIQEIAGNMEMVREQHKQAKSDWVRHALEQNIGWLQEALYVEIVWNQTHHE